MTGESIACAKRVSLETSQWLWMVLKIESFLSGGWPGLDSRWWYVIGIDQSEIGDSVRCGLSTMVAQ